jgi:hypothetical protein
LPIPLPGDESRGTARGAGTTGSAGSREPPGFPGRCGCPSRPLPTPSLTMSRLIPPSVRYIAISQLSTRLCRSTFVTPSRSTTASTVRTGVGSSSSSISIRTRTSADVRTDYAVRDSLASDSSR